MHQGTKEQATSSHWALISHFKWAILTFMVEQLPGRRGGKRQAGLGWQDRAASEDAASAPFPATQRNPNQHRPTPFPLPPPQGHPDLCSHVGGIQPECFLDSPPTPSRCCWVYSLYHVCSQSIKQAGNKFNFLPFWAACRKKRGGLMQEHTALVSYPSSAMISQNLLCL